MGWSNPKGWSCTTTNTVLEELGHNKSSTQHSSSTWPVLYMTTCQTHLMHHVDSFWGSSLLILIFSLMLNLVSRINISLDSNPHTVISPALLTNPMAPPTARLCTPNMSKGNGFKDWIDEIRGPLPFYCFLLLHFLTSIEIGHVWTDPRAQPALVTSSLGKVEKV